MNWKRVPRENIPQLLFLLAAFMFMAAASYYSVKSITENQMSESAEGMLRQAESNIKVSFRELETAISNASLSITHIIEGGGAQDEVRRFFNDTADWFLADADRWLAYRGIYGAVRGEFIDGTRWNPPPGYDFSAQPWFISAREAKGRVAVTALSPDVRGTDAANPGGVIVSVSREVYGTDRGYLGTVAIDVYPEPFFRGVVSLSPVGGGYGMIVNDALKIMAHKNAGLIDEPMAGVSEGFGELAEALAAGREISGKVIADWDGVRRIAFFRKIYNGWYVGTLIPADKFYGPARLAAVSLSVLGVLMFFPPGVALRRPGGGKTRSGKESGSKAGSLAVTNSEINAPTNAADMPANTPEENAVSDGVSPPSAFTRGVDGIDLECALEGLDGNRELLFRVIRTYIKHTSVLLDKIGSPSADGLGEYAIIVHGIKGSSSSLHA
ncbi:MAG: cache domain-containing protein, partial [Synergistaceae bacterium]|nr:cache domain-containing protein [Synergistaceae bacterium]